MICLTVTVDCQKIKQISTVLTMVTDVAEIKEMSIVKICNESSSWRHEIALISQSGDTIACSRLVSNATQTETSAFYERVPIMQAAFTASLTNYMRQR